MASAEQVQQMIQAALQQQQQHFQQELQQQAQLAQQRYAQAQAALAQAQTQIVQLQQQAAPAGRGTPSGMDPRLLNKVETFSGSDEKWKPWKFKFTSVLAAMTCRQTLTDLHVNKRCRTPTINFRQNLHFVLNFCHDFC